MQNNKNNKKRGVLDKRNKLNDLTGSEWIKFTKSWYVLSPRQRGDQEFVHPAKFPEDLVERYVSFFTKRGQTVFDPFLGIGSTIVACETLGRKGIGIEYSKKYADLAKKRIKKMEAKGEHNVVQGNSMNLLDIWKNPKNQLPEKVDFIITSPPYWNMLGESRGNVLSAHKKRKLEGLDVKYSNNKNDLGNLKDYKEFLTSLKSIFEQCYDVLKSGGYMVVVLQNLRTRDGRMCTLAWDIVKELENKYHFVGEQLWLQDNKQLGIWGYPSVFVSNIHHHYCLIFYRNNIKLK
jgi:DNA modification methylase